MVPQVIGFTGLAGSGKTTAANALCVSGYTLMKPGDDPQENLAMRLSMAQPLRALCRMAFPWIDRAYFDGVKEQKETQIPGMAPGITGRKILQHIGTEGFRALDPDIWIKLAEHSLLHAPKGTRLITFDDIRFPNEATMLRKHGILIRINRPGLVAMDHDSERHVLSLPVDFEIDNDGTIADFHRKVRDAAAAAA